MKTACLICKQICQVSTVCLIFLLTGGIAPAAARQAPNVPGITGGSGTGGEEVPDWLARWELARCLTILKRYDEAIADYQKVLQEKPDQEEVRIELAQVLHWHGQGAAAAAMLKGISTAKLGPQEKILLADIHMIQKEYDLAEPLYRSALKEQPQDHQTRLKLAEMLSWAKKNTESLTEYRLLLEALPDDIQIRRKYAMVLIWDGQHEKAVPELRRTLK